MAARFRAAVDGGSRGNPGPAAWGVALRDDDGVYLEGIAGTLGRATNNIAEYQGLLAALDLAAERGADDVEIHADSELMVRQVQGRYRVRHPDLAPLHAEAMRRIARFPRFRIVHVRREENKDADRLVNLALNRAAASLEAQRFHDVPEGPPAP
jgi:ribonuclease HI